MRVAFASRARNTGSSSPDELEMMLNTSDVAVCGSNALPSYARASTRSRLHAWSCCCKSALGLRLGPTCAFAVVPVERSLRPRRLAGLRDKITSKACQSTKAFAEVVAKS